MSVALDSGSSFAGYQIESVVGRGGMGVVYRATDLSLERPVALKLVAPELAEDELFRRRFLKEPRLAASLDHPNVVPIYEAGEHDGQLYLAMRFVDGSDMRTLLRREGGLPAERALDILAQVAGALDAAHRRGLVHRDVKPANVLVDEDGHAYLTDFGVTKQLGGNTTETGQIVGTLDYVAPEQIRGEDVDARADGYALACVLYECLAGRPPFHRATEAETLWAHMQEPPPPLPGHPALDRVMVKALAKDPARPARDLRRADRRRAGGARAPDRPAAAAPPPSRDSRRRACWCSPRPRSRSCWHRATAALPRCRGRFCLRATGSPPSASTGSASPRSRDPTRRRATSQSARAASGCSTRRTRGSRASIRAQAT